MKWLKRRTKGRRNNLDQPVLDTWFDHWGRKELSNLGYLHLLHICYHAFLRVCYLVKDEGRMLFFC